MLYFVFSLVIIAADRLVKWWVTSNVDIGTKWTFIPGIAQITRVHNTGMAFSLLDSPSMRWVLVGLTVVATAALIAVILRYRHGSLGRVGAAMALGGAVGNLIDRVLSGYVVDMFELTFVNFAVFNIADIFVVAGVILFAAHYIIASRRTARTERRSVLQFEADERLRAERQSAETGESAPTAPASSDTKVLPRVAKPTEAVKQKPAPKPTPVAEPEPEIEIPASLRLSDAELSETSILEEYDIQRRMRDYVPPKKQP
ncbi:MAG: signal peptidase II [Oscillospiraceae bacterium]|jgi:signal peptidase II|nr:signal peptidase II [Oscillospiraceae bacterium]